MSLLFDVGMATAPVTGYVLQYRLISKNQSVGAFSIDICLVLLFANILRINFYIFNRYELALLFQSIIMILAQLLLLRICIFFRQDSEKLKGSEQQEVEDEEFWRWSSFTTYWHYVAGFSVASLLLSSFMWMLDMKIYGEVVGLVALLSQSLLIFPQILQIFKRSRVGGISYSLISLNLVGDIIKMVYFFINNQAFQFKLCGGIQIFLDVFVIVQIIYYRNKEKLTELKEEAAETQLKETDLKEKDKVDRNRETEEINEDLDGSLSQTNRIDEEHVQSIEGLDSETKFDHGSSDNQLVHD